MSEVARFYGIGIYVYFERMTQHHEPHFYATYSEYDASFAINPLRFRQVKLDAAARTLVWLAGADFDLETLYH